MSSVTVGVPVYRRLEFLPRALASVQAQEHGEIELLVSDNGQNGEELERLVERHYGRPYRIRRNETTVPMSRHFNQIVGDATGDYFVLLCDDDEIGPSFVNALASILDRDPDVSVALPRVDLLNETGELRERQDRFPPERFDGMYLVRNWTSGRFVSFATMMARTREIRAVGGYPEMPNGDDDALVLKLALESEVAFDPDAVFRKRWYEASAGLAVSPWELAEDIRNWFEFLDSDTVLREFARRRPEDWKVVRRLMREKGWTTYRYRWRSMYRDRMGTLEWLRAGFALPFIPRYYAWLAGYLLRKGASLPSRLFAG